MRYLAINSDLFVQNRRRLGELMNPRSVAVLNSNDIMPTSADGVRPFIQDADMFYLSGIDQEESILVICPGAREVKHREVLFLRKTDENIAIWEGAKYTKEEAREMSGIATVYWMSEFEQIFRSLVFESENVYLNTNEHTRADTTVETRNARFLKWCMNEFPLHHYERLAPLMHRLRAVKSPAEIELIRTACRITDETFRRLLGFIKPGVWEYEIEAEIYHEFLRNRSQGPAYESIVASGVNTCVLHYVKNDRKCREGELVLIDFGAEYANYASDVTRTVPVSGRFSSRQKDIYNAVLRVQKAAMQMLRPGNTFREYNREVGHIMEQELIDLGLLHAEDVKRQDSENPLYKRYYMHGTSHFIGLNVHDVGDTCRTFEAGMVMSCEPGIYIREEGTGIRLENDVLITENDPVDLTAEIPIEADHIEELMNR